MFEICSDLSKSGHKINYFCQHSKKAKKWPNHFISGKQFQKRHILPKKGQMATIIQVLANQVEKQ